MNDDKQTVYLAGAGMGTGNTFTIEVMECFKNCDCIIGAGRMLEGVAFLNKPSYCAYLPDEVKVFISAHQEYRNIVVAFSGDTGFFSGAKEMYHALKDICAVKILPGISSVVYLAARLGVSWDDAGLISLHGRWQPYIHEIAGNKKMFVLLGGPGCAEHFFEDIRAYSLDEIKIWIGRLLSGADESIVCRTGKELVPDDLKGLVVLYIENPNPLMTGNRNLPDAAFIRGGVPMTKEEVRAVSIFKLGLTKGAVLYDIGAGTGSVAIEAALHTGNIRIYAIERNPEGTTLIKQNQKRFYTDQITVISGTAPDVLVGLEPPSHVFIGGSSGKLKAILSQVKEMNPQVKVVLNAISLETLKEVLEAEQEGLLGNPEIVQISVAKAKELSGYHMMNGQNPVYVITER